METDIFANKKLKWTFFSTHVPFMDLLLNSTKSKPFTDSVAKITGLEILIKKTSWKSKMGVHTNCRTVRPWETNGFPQNKPTQSGSTKSRDILKEIGWFSRKKYLYFWVPLKKTHTSEDRRIYPSRTTISGAKTHKALKLATSPTVSASDSNKPQKKNLRYLQDEPLT